MRKLSLNCVMKSTHSSRRQELIAGARKQQPKVANSSHIACPALAVRRTFHLKKHGEGAFSTRFSPSGNTLAVSCGDGSIELFDCTNAASQFARSSLSFAHSTQVPVMSVRFVSEDRLLSVSVSGHSHLWNAAISHPVETLSISTRELYCADTSPVCNKAVVAGQQGVVDVVDLATSRVCLTMQDADSNADLAHIYSARLHATDASLCVTGGWDRVVRLWDIRNGAVVGKIHGPFICGDSIEMDDTVLVTASWVESSEHAVQVWDYRRLEKDPVSVSLQTDSSAYLYAAHMNSHAIAVGGSGAHEVRIISRADRSIAGSGQLVGKYSGARVVDEHSPVAEAEGSHAVQAVALSPAGSDVAVVGLCNSVCIFALN